MITWVIAPKLVCKSHGLCVEVRAARGRPRLTLLKLVPTRFLHGSSFVQLVPARFLHGSSSVCTDLQWHDDARPLMGIYSTHGHIICGRGRGSQIASLRA